MRNDTPLVTIEQYFALRLTPSDAGALLGALDRPLLDGTPVARIYDALAEATGYGRRVPCSGFTAGEPAPRPVRSTAWRSRRRALHAELPGGADGREAEQPHFSALEDPLLPRASAGQFIDDPLS